MSVAGREVGREIHLPSSKVSRKHCAFEVRGGEVVVRDLGSANGVVVEGQKIREAVLAIGQRIQIGDYLLELTQSKPPASPSGPPPLDDLFGESGASAGASEAPPPMFGGFSGGETASPFGGQGVSQQGPPPLDDLFGESNKPSGEASFGTQNPQQGLNERPPPPQSSSKIQTPRTQNTPNSSGKTVGDLGIPGLDKAKEFLIKIPWSGRLGGLFLIALLAALFAPLGGVKHLLSNVDSKMEGLAKSYAVELTSTIARVNGEALSKLDATSIGSGSIGAADRAKGVVAGEVFLLDSRGRIKPTSDRPNPRPRLVQRASETQDVAYETDPDTDLFYIVAPIRISIGNAPAQVRGFVYVGFSVEDFLEDTGRANDLFPSALVLMFILFGVLFWSVRSHANRPILAAVDESELAMKGHVEHVKPSETWPELEALLHTVNRAISRSGVVSGGEHEDSSAITESLVMASSWPVVVADGDLNVTFINEIALRVFGVKSSDAVGTHVSKVINKEVISKAVLGALRSIETGTQSRVTQTVNVDGSPRRVTVSSKLAPQPNSARSEAGRRVFEFVVVVIA